MELCCDPKFIFINGFNAKRLSMYLSSVLCDIEARYLIKAHWWHILSIADDKYKQDISAKRVFVKLFTCFISQLGYVQRSFYSLLPTKSWSYGGNRGNPEIAVVALSTNVLVTDYLLYLNPWIADIAPIGLPITAQ